MLTKPRTSLLAMALSLAALAAPFTHPLALAQDAAGQGVISIRALAERQRKIEQQEFLNKITGQAPQANTQQQAAPTANNSVDVPPLELPSPALQALMEPTYTPKNTILAIYGPVEDLTMEAADGRGGIDYFKVGQRWANHRIVALGQEGAVLEPLNGKGKRIRVPMGGQP
ncbi:hypothetical protein [Limnobacter sp.]|uniref:hypothetical protein n=1 Tax=Limnobacter sp. TaxID=2003368 RepID=UPI003512500E